MSNNIKEFTSNKMLNADYSNKTPDLYQWVYSVSTGEMNITETQLFQPAFSK